ncbi:MAG: hypothetical protein IKK21_08085 [Clostridia bacterium]|nr:hypothetical protein [Clostridia bacterium]
MQPTPRNHRTQHRAVPQYIPVQPPQPHYQPAPPPAQPQPPRKEKKKRRRFSLIKTLLMLIGLGTVLVVLARYVIVPVLVMLPAWLGGGV